MIRSFAVLQLPLLLRMLYVFNMSKHVSGKMRIGWRVLEVMLATDVSQLLAEVSVNLLTSTISL